MNTHRSWLHAVVVVTFIMLFVSLGGCGGDAPTPIIHAQNPNIYELSAGSASFSAVAGDTTGTTFQLSLANVGKDIFFFPVQSDSQVGTTAVASVISSWLGIYGSIAPVSVLKGTLPNQEKIVLFCKLDKPVYQEATGRLNFSITYLDGSPKPVSGITVTDLILLIPDNSSTGQEEWAQLLLSSQSLQAFVGKTVLTDLSPVPESAVGLFDLDAIEKLAANDTDQLPLRLNRLMIFRSGFVRWQAVAGTSGPDYVSSIPSFQVVYPEKSVIIDPPCGEATYRKNSLGHTFQFYQDNFDRLQKTMQQADLIFSTHEHFDHIGGLAESPWLDQVLQKAVLTQEQLGSTKWIEQSGFGAKLRARLSPLKYANYHRLLPGIVLIHTPGHSVGHQMIYIKLKGGGAFLLTGDIAWNFDALRKLTGRPLLVSLSLGEDRDMTGHQIRWLHDEIVMKPERGIQVVVSHDFEMLEGFVANGLIGDGFE